MHTEAEFHNLQNSLSPLMPVLGKVADTVLGEGVSSYPIFVVFQGAQEIGLGLPLVQAEEGGQQNWTIHISTLEEMVSRQIVGMDRVDRFRQVFKDPTGHLCMLVWDQGEARFIFLPRLDL